MGHPKQRAAAPRNGFAPKPDLQAREAERQLAQRLRDRCEWQARQLGLARGELKRAIRGFDALAVSTQHFFRKVRPWLSPEGLFSYLGPGADSNAHRKCVQ
ncbi:hypothetical protein U0070_025125 [Myodes glareolus]|uniref:Uncharacterized protein n=1 Tax=Myodes glareolus TaxID=447135 RepID=A0AAW0I829_MYOGA